MACVHTKQNYYHSNIIMYVTYGKRDHPDFIGNVKK